MVNPLGTVTTVVQQSIVSGGASIVSPDLDEFSYYGDGDEFIHENCDEGLFRPVVAVFGSPHDAFGNAANKEIRTQTSAIGQTLIIPVIEKIVADKHEHMKRAKIQLDAENAAKFAELALLNKNSDEHQPMLQGKQQVVIDNLLKTSFQSPLQKSPISETKKCEKIKKSDKAEIVVKKGEYETIIEKKSVDKPNQKKSHRKLSKVDEPAQLEVEAEHIKEEITPSNKIRKNLIIKTNENLLEKSTTINLLKTSVTRNELQESAPISFALNKNPDNLATEERSLGGRSSKNSTKCVEQSISVSNNCEPSLSLVPASTYEKENKTDLFLINPDIVDMIELVTVPFVDNAKKAISTEKLSKKQKKMEKLQVSQRDGIHALSVDAIDSTGLNVIECFEQECSSIQDSIFIDPVVTKTFVVKKTNKSKWSNLFNSKEQTKAESLTKSDISEFADAFAPLEPFDLNFENLTLYPDNSNSLPTDEFVSLINFQSPMEDVKLIDQVCGNAVERCDGDAALSSTGNDEKKLIFSLCSTIQNCEDEDFKGTDEPPALLYECQDSDYKSLEQEIDETYLSLELPTKEETNSSSTDDTEESFSQQETKIENLSSTGGSGVVSGDDGYTASESVLALTASLPQISSAYKLEDDEELQPLIGLTMSHEDTKLMDSTDEHFQANTLPTPTSPTQIDPNKLQPPSAVTGSVSTGFKKKNKKKRR